MSRRRRQQRKRARHWSLEVRDTVYGWRASWWFKGREMHPAYHFHRVENRFNLTLRYPNDWSRLLFGEEIFDTGRVSYSRPELQRLPMRTETGRLLQKALENNARMVGPVTFLTDCNFAELKRKVALWNTKPSDPVADILRTTARIRNRTHYLCAKCGKDPAVYIATGNEAEHWCLCEGCAPAVDSEYLARCYARRET